MQQEFQYSYAATRYDARTIRYAEKTLKKKLKVTE